MSYEAVFGPIRRPLSPSRRFAMAIAAGELKGGQYDWDTRRWKKVNP